MKNKCEPNDYYETPPDIFEALDKEFNFQWDACVTRENTKVQGCYFDEQDNALVQNWAASAQVIWCNPPYSKSGMKDAFIAKAAEAALNGATVVMLIPAKVNTKAFHQHIYHKPNVEIRYPKGRPTFWLDGKPSLGSGRNEIMIVIFRPPSAGVLVALGE